MSGVYEILAKIQAKPGMYIGRPSVSDLFMFLVGYECSRSEFGIENTEESEDFYGEFQPWLQKKLGITTVSSWSKMIMLYCHDEKAGFEKFFNLLDEFKQRNQHLDGNEVHNISEVVVTSVKTHFCPRSISLSLCMIQGVQL